MQRQTKLQPKRSTKKKSKAPKKTSKPQALPQVGPSDFRAPARSLSLNPEFTKYARQLILPIDTGGVDGVCVLPSSRSTQMCARHIRRVVTLDSDSHPNGFTVIMTPDLFMPGFISGTAPTTAPFAGAGLVSVVGPLNPREIDVDAQRLPYEVAADGKILVGQFQTITDSLGVNRNGIRLTPQAAAANTFFSYNNTGIHPVILNTVTKVAGGAWSAPTVDKIAPYSQMPWIIALGVGVDAIAFYFSADTSKSATGTISISASPTQIVLDTGVQFAPAFERFALDKNIQQCRVTSMSILITNTSSALANGGTIEAGCVPRDFNPFETDRSLLAGLPANRRYEGAAAQGGYCFWNPDQDDEWQPDGLEMKQRQLNDSNYLMQRLRGWGGGPGNKSSATCYFDWVVEFYTENQLFEKVLTPPQTPAFNNLMYVLATLPRATCNPGHFDNMKALMRGALGAAAKAHGWYKQHKAVIDPALELAMLALA